MLYYFTGNRLSNIEGDLLEQRSRTANAGAETFLEGLRDPEDGTLPEAEAYALELVQSVSQPTGLGVLYLGPDGEPLAARTADGDTLEPEVAYDRLRVEEDTVEEVLQSSDRDGSLVLRPGSLRDIAIWPLAAGDNVQGVMVYSSPQAELNQTLSYLRFGILGAIGASILLAGIASLLLSREITAPLSRTRDAVIRVASGDYRPVPVQREDELGEVARAFNYMAGEVEHYIGEIQEQKSRLEAVLEASPEAVVAIDSSEKVTMANPAAARMLGISTEDHGHKLENTGISGEILACVREASDNGSSVREVESGKNNYWTYAAQMGRRDEGETNGTNGTGTILAIRDITEHRALERARTNFVSDVSHELRTPLTTIQSAVDLMQRARENLDPLEHRALELADQELKRMREMVEELLVLAQVDSWQYSLETGPTDLGKVLQSSVDSLGSKAERFGVDLRLNSQDAEYPCVCDGQKLYQVFLNVLDNAIKYSDPGAEVEASIEEEESHLRVKIQDTGVGIPEEDLPQLFERFYRVNKDRSRATGGSGLGLAIAKEIVELHNGEITVESRVGVGSVFEIRLPKEPLSRSANYAI